MVDPVSSPAPDPTPGATPPAPAPAPAPSPQAPPDDQGTKPFDPDAYDRDQLAQFQGARKALLASSMSGAVATDPDKQSKIAVLADKLGLSQETVEANYPQLSQQTQLQDTDYNQLLEHHPEVADWLSVPDNANLAHDEVPQLTELDKHLQALGGRDATGILPPGFLFQPDGQIRGPLNEDGTPPVVYSDLGAVRRMLERQDAWERSGREQVDTMAAALQKPGSGFLAGAMGSAESTYAALLSTEGTFERWQGDPAAGQDLSDQAARERQLGSQILEASSQTQSGALGWLSRTLGSLAADAPLYLAGGEIAGAGDLARSLRAIDLAKPLAKTPVSDYLVDAWKSAQAYSVVAARSGINQGAEQGPAYGITDFLINALGPAAAGSKFGLAGAVIPGAESVPRGTLTSLASGLMLHAGSQGGAMAATELANALHEYTTGVDPTALDPTTLVPRLAQAGAMGAVMSTAFRLPGEVGGFVQARQVMANTVMRSADRFATAVQTIQALKVAERSPARLAELIQRAVPAGQRTTFFQPDDFETIAQAVGMRGEDLAAAMHIEEQYRLAQAAGQSLQVPTSDLLQYAAGLENPEAIKAIIERRRDHPQGASVTEANAFYEGTPQDLAKQKADLEASVATRAQAIPEDDLIYQHVLGQSTGAGSITDAAKQEARLVSAFYHVGVERRNAEVGPGAPKMDPFEEFQKRPLSMRQEGAPMLEPVDTLLDKLRAGDVPTEEQAYGHSMMRWLKSRGIQDPHEDIAAMEAHHGIEPEQSIIKRNGYDLETVAQMAHEKGFTAGPEEQTFLDALAEEMAGKPSYRTGGETEHAPMREGLVALKAALDRKGLDLAKHTNAEAKAALAGEFHGSTKLEQSGLRVKGRPVVVADVPYGGGTSRDGKTVYIDRRVPHYQTVDGKRIDVWQAIAHHELKEFAEMQAGKSYADAHNDATTEEDHGVDHQGVSHADYERIIAPFVTRARAEFDPRGVPMDLNEQPYKDMGEEALLRGRSGGAANRQRLEQPGDSTGPRASIEFDEGRHFVITRTGKADFSSVVHELGHYFLEVLGDWAEREGEPETLKADDQKVLDFLGVKSRADIKVEHHEKFAQALETYLMEGHAPSAELRPVFQRFAIWMTNIYRGLKGLVTLTPEVRKVFDRMLASDDAIKQVETELNYSTIFPNREASGMSERGWKAYQNDIRADKSALQANVFRDAMAALRQQRTRTYRKEMSAAKVAAADIVNWRPNRRAENALVRGVDQEGNPLRTIPKLNLEELQARYGQDVRGKLPRGISAMGGMPLDVAAEAYGFHSPDDLFTALRNLTPRSEEVRQEAERILNQRHPEMGPDALHESAMDSVHANSAHADVLNRETAALAIKAGRRAIPREQMRQVAQGIIDRTNQEEVRRDIYEMAERKASREAVDAATGANPDYTGAFLAAQRAELNHHLYRAAMEAEKVIANADTLMKRGATLTTRQMLGKSGGRFGVGADGTRMALDSDEQAQAFIAEHGGTVMTYEQAFDQLRDFYEDRGQWKGLDYGQVKDFVDEAKMVLHRARESFNLMVDGKREKLDEGLAESSRVQRESTGGKQVIKPLAEGWRWRLAKGIREGDAFMATLSAIVRQMDDDQADGWHYRNLLRPLTDAANDQLERQIVNSKHLRELLDAHGKRGEFGKTLFIPEINAHMSLENRLSVLLQSGSTRSKERVMTGYGWDQAQMDAIVRTLDQKDIALARGIWDMHNAFWPHIEALEHKLNGIAPEKRDSIPVQTAFGTIDGKYFPIVPDADRSARAAQLSLDPNPPMLGSGTPRKGFTKKTVESTGIPPRLDLGAVTRHNDDVAHFLSHAEAIDNLNKLINNSEWKAMVTANFGVDAWKMIADRVDTVARGARGQLTPAERVLRWFRVRSGMATMGLNVMSGVSHIFGIPQSMYRVGAGPWTRSLLSLVSTAGSAESKWQFIAEKSSFMRNNHLSFIPERIEQLDQGTTGQSVQWFRDHAYSLMHTMLRVVNAPTWLAEYDRALAEEPTDDARAVGLADQAVRDTQGSGQTIDMSKAQDANELTRSLMQFSAFFTRTYNLGRESIVGYDTGNHPESIMRMAKAFLVLVSAPTIAMAIFKQQVKPDPTNDGSISWWAKRLAKDHLEYLLSTLILGRELGGAIDGYDYQGPAGMRSIAGIDQFVKDAMRLSFGSEKSEARATRAAYQTGLSLFGLPANQIDHVIQGLLYDQEKRSFNPNPLLFGPPPHPPR